MLAAVTADIHILNMVMQSGLKKDTSDMKLLKPVIETTETFVTFIERVLAYEQEIVFLKNSNYVIQRIAR